MGKSIISIILLFILPFLVFAAPTDGGEGTTVLPKWDNVVVTAHVAPGTNLPEGGQEILPGVKLYLDVIPVTNSTPDTPTWSLDAKEAGTLNGEDVSANLKYNSTLVSDNSDNADACDSFFIAAAVTCNVETPQNFTVSFSSDDWTFSTTSDGSYTSVSEDKMAIDPDETTAVSSFSEPTSAIIETSDGDTSFSCTVKPGLVEDPTMIGYSHVTWELKSALDAGYYKATVKVEITEGGQTTPSA